MNNYNFEPARLQFRSLQTADLPLIHLWLNTSYVAKWWCDQPVSLEEVIEEYQAYFDGRDPIRPYLISYDRVPVGQVQTYNFRDYPEWRRIVEPAEESSGVDIMIGHPDYIHRGLGSLILRKFIAEIVFEQPDIEACLIDPDPDNRAAIRAYEKAGFKYWKTTVGGETPDTVSYIMRLTRAEFSGGKHNN